MHFFQALPLGPEFQCQVASLVKYDENASGREPVDIQPEFTRVVRFFQEVIVLALFMLLTPFRCTHSVPS